MTTQNLWEAAKAVLRGRFIATLSQETKQNKKTLNRQSNFTPKTTEKIRTKKPPKLVEGKEIIKIQAERNEKEMK